MISPKYASNADKLRIDRRRFIKLAGVAVGATFLPGFGYAAKGVFSYPKRRLSFYNFHTKERLKNITYWSNGVYLPDSLNAINRILRDHRTDGIINIDKGLLDFLYALRQKIDKSCEFGIISGYRSPRTNAMLRKRSKKIAAKSYHILGKAVDIRVSCCKVSRLRKAAIGLHKGGVGYYPRSNFIHVDVGPVRSWWA